MQINDTCVAGDARAFLEQEQRESQGDGSTVWVRYVGTTW